MAEDLPTGGTLGWPGRVAVGILRGEAPQVFLAESDAVLGRLLALRLVAVADPADLGADAVAEIRDALVAERWGDAVLTWMSATGEIVDGYPDEEVVTEAELDAQRASMEIRLSPIFRDPGSPRDDPPGRSPGGGAPGDGMAARA